MKTIHIFLSSSEADTHDIRMELGNYIRALNDRFHDRLYFRLWMNEGDSDHTEQIADSEYVYTIFFHRAEDGTRKDFYAAYDRFKKNGSPKILTFFKDIPAGESAEESVKSFMDELADRLEHYYTKFGSIDTVMLKILLELAGSPENPVGKVEFQDSRLLLNDEVFDTIHLDNLPFYGNHETIRQLKKELERLKTEIAEAKKAHLADPEDEELGARFYDLRNRRATAEKQLHEYEKQLLEVSMSLTKRATDGKPITHRTRLAMEYFDEGKVAEALAVLDPEEFQLDLQRLNEMNEVLSDRYEALIRELTTKIDILKSQGVTSRSAEEIKALYETARDIVWEHNLDLGVVVDYVGFLDDENDYARGIEIGDKLYHRFKSMESVKGGQWARFCGTLANLYSDTNRMTEAKKLYREALAIYRRLAGQHPEAYEPDVAGTCNNLAALYYSTNRLTEAEKLYQEALAIRRRLAEQHSEAYKPDVAMTCNNLGTLYKNTNRMKEAEELYLESLAIRRRLTEQYPEAYELYVATTCNNLANLYYNTNRMMEAEKLYRDALGIYRRLAEQHPKAYSSDFMYTCYNLALLYVKMYRIQETRSLFSIIFDMVFDLADQNPDVFDPQVAQYCYTYGLLCNEYTMLGHAEDFLNEALERALPYKDTNPTCRKIVEAMT